jgi:crossover junction endodeoxyribonuclease RuvC
LGQARGACVTALTACGLAVAEYTPLQMKQAITGHGKAAKSQVQEMVKRLLRLPVLPGKDAADALGLAITQAHAGASISRLESAGMTSPRVTGRYRGGRTY